jgi:hypothetical protein
VITKERCVWQGRIAKGAVRQEPESATLAEPGFSTIVRMAIGTKAIHRCICSEYIRFSQAVSETGCQQEVTNLFEKMHRQVKMMTMDSILFALIQRSAFPEVLIDRGD